MVDRSKFKEALNELSSSERTALLYLEELIREVRKSIPVIKEAPSQTKTDLRPILRRLDNIEHTVKVEMSIYRKIDERIEADLETMVENRRYFNDVLEKLTIKIKTASRISSQIMENVRKANKLRLTDSLLFVGKNPPKQKDSTFIRTDKEDDEVEP